MKEKKRKIIQIIADFEGWIAGSCECIDGNFGSGICYLCDDGSVWTYNKHTRKHTKIDTEDIETSE